MRTSYKKVFCIGIVFTICLCLSYGCGAPERLKAFKTELSAEEHIVNIIRRTEEKYAEQLENGTITDFQVYTLWSFKEQPEYFLVEFDGGFDGEAYEPIGPEYDTRYAHLIGFIVDDQYHIYGHSLSVIKSQFREQGLLNEKKYYGYCTRAIKRDGKMICIGTGGAVSKDKPGEVLSKSRQNYLATHDYRLNNDLY